MRIARCLSDAGTVNNWEYNDKSGLAFAGPRRRYDI